MKITDSEGLNQLLKGATPQSPKKPSNTAEFKTMLSESLGETNQNEKVSEAPRLTELYSVPKIDDIKFQSGLVDKAARVIDLMELYTSSLSNPRKTLRDIEPELMRFVQEAQSLHDECLKTSDPDTEMKNITESLLRTARLEALRFQRGDYLDTE